MRKIDLELLKTKLPHSPGILGKDEYFNSAVLIPLVFIDDEYHFLFEKRAQNIKQGGEICFPGGEIDIDDKNIEAAAIREVYEEIGIPLDKINLIGKLDTLIGPRGVTVDSCVAELNIQSLTECKIDTSEVEKIFTIPVFYFEQNEPLKYKVVSEFNYTFYNERGEVENLIPSRKNSTNEHIDQSYRNSTRSVLVYKTHGEIIWGITARLVYEVVRMLK